MRLCKVVFFRIRFFCLSLIMRKKVSLHLGRKVRVGSAVKLKLSGRSGFFLDDGVKVKDGVIFECHGNIKVGKNSVLGSYSWLQGHGEIVIGNSVMTGPYCSIVASDHSYSSVGVDFILQPFVKGAVEIGNNVWIGSHVTILNGSKIGDNVIIGAGALVKGTLEENGVYVGVPARRVKEVW